MAQALTLLDVDAEIERDLPSQYRVTSALQFMQAIASVLQTTNDVVEQWAAAYDLDTAVGLQLDALGERLGQPREGGRYPDGESDSIYRMKVRAAILRNRSGGTIPDLIAVVKALFATSSPVVIIARNGIAAFSLVVELSTSPTADEVVTLGEFVQAAKAAGVAATVYVGSPYTFAYTTFPDPPYRGYNGGSWARILRF
jgi:hypothetical protein